MPSSRVDRRREPARDRERHVLLARTAAPDRAGILAAVAGVDRDDEVAALAAAAQTGLTAFMRPAGGRGARAPEPLRRGRRACRERPGPARDRRDRRYRGAAQLAGSSTTNRCPAVPSGATAKLSRSAARIQVEHEAQAVARLRPGPQRRHRSLAIGQAAFGMQARVFARSTTMRSGLSSVNTSYFDRARQVEHEARALRSRPEPHVGDRVATRRPRWKRRRECHRAGRARQQGIGTGTRTWRVIYSEAYSYFNEIMKIRFLYEVRS